MQAGGRECNSRRLHQEIDMERFGAMGPQPDCKSGALAGQAGSNPARSTNFECESVVQRQDRGLQNRGSRFESGPSRQILCL